MAYAVTPAGQGQRPGTVSAASALLYLCAAIQLASIVVSLLSLGPIQTVLEEEFADVPEAGSIRTVTVVIVILVAVFSAALAVGLIVLGALIGRGKNAARIVTWVLAGIGLLCYGCGLAGSAAQDSLSGMGGADQTSQDIQRRLTEVVPGWQNVVGTIASIAVLIILIVVIILLALPASNAFFRKEQEVWVPPTEFPGGAAS